MNPELNLALTGGFVVFVILDIFVNVILCLAIQRKRALQTPMNLLIFHLAITDIVIGVFVIPRHILSYVIIYPNSTSSDYICRALTGGSFIWTSVTAASGFLTIIALERLFAVVYPHKTKLRITNRRLKWLVAACWITSLAFNVPSQLVLKYDHDHRFCMENWPDWVNPKAYVGLAFFAGNFSVIAMFVIYSIILHSLWKKNKGSSEVSRTARINARKRVTKMLILMTIVHLLCRAPNYTFYAMIYFYPDAKYGSIVYNFTVFLILLNSASHPFFYCWYMDSLRKQVFEIFPRVCSGRCPTKLQSFNLVSSGDGVGSTTPENKKGQADGLMYSVTVGSDSEEPMNKIDKDKVKGRINKEVDGIEDSNCYNTPFNDEKLVQINTNSEPDTTQYDSLDHEAREETEEGGDNHDDKPTGDKSILVCENQNDELKNIHIDVMLDSNNEQTIDKDITCYHKIEVKKDNDNNDTQSDEQGTVIKEKELNHQSDTHGDFAI